MGFDILKSIKAYHKNGYGLAWDIFWDFNNENPLKNQKDLREYATQLFCYLCCFGMARASTNLANKNLDSFNDFLNDSKATLIEVSEYNFLELKPKDKIKYNHCIDNLKEILKDYGISSSNTMVSKILLGVTGQCVAIDRFFKETYKYYYEGENPNHIFETLLILQQSYNKEWENKICKLEKKYFATRRKKHTTIPIPRLIDMAFWWYGSD